MTYHKRVAKKRKCAHCGTKFLSNHQRRIYCSQSCNTLAWRARHAQQAQEDAQPAGPAASGLAFSARNVGVLALSSALGTLAAQLGTDLTQRLLHGGTDRELLQAELRAGLAQLGVVPAAAGSAGGAPAPAGRQAPGAATLRAKQAAVLEQVLAAPLASPEQLAAQLAAFEQALLQPWPAPPAP
jgi:ribosomal protein S27AE